MQSAIFENARILDGSSDEGEHDRFVRVADELIEISDKPIKDSSAHRIDLRGKTLMPGLIDCHTHIVSPFPDPADNARLPNSLIALHAARIMKQMLCAGSLRSATSAAPMPASSAPLIRRLSKGRACSSAARPLSRPAVIPTSASPGTGATLKRSIAVWDRSAVSSMASRPSALPCAKSCAMAPNTSR